MATSQLPLHNTEKAKSSERSIAFLSQSAAKIVKRA